jgi:chaperonin cofactor prefoldin
MANLTYEELERRVKALEAEIRTLKSDGLKSGDRIEELTKTIRSNRPSAAGLKRALGLHF